MELHFCSQRLQAIAESAHRLDRLLGHQAAAVARQRLSELAAAENLFIVGKLLTLRLAAVPDTTNRFAIRITDTIPLTFEALGETGHRVPVDLRRIVSIRVLMIGESNGR
jgi:hypothetical protein